MTTFEALPLAAAPTPLAPELPVHLTHFVGRDQELDDLTPFVARYGAKGLAYVKINEKAKGREGLQSPVVKNLHDAALAQIIEEAQAMVDAALG